MKILPSHHRTARLTHRVSARVFLFFLVGFGLLSGVARQVDLANPPRLATMEASQPVVQSTDAVYIPAPTPTALPDGVTRPTDEVGGYMGSRLTVWISETSPKYRTLAREMADDFAQRYGANVAIQLVSPALMPDLISTAVLSDTLPDLILHPVEYTMGWLEDGVLDAAAANEAIEMLGRDTFDPAALALVEQDGLPAALPSDGYLQLLLYRRDWFEALGLREPVDYAAMAAAAEAIYDRERIISGLIIPTESNLVATHRAFEQIALANGCGLVDASGEVTIQSDACADALDHYYTTINRFSPPGVQTETSALRGYLAGRTGMIVTSPATLRALAGFDPLAPPTCPECGGADGVDYLARNTGILTTLRGRGAGASDASLGNLTYLGITSTADRAAAIEFARYWFEAGYERWLALDSERKVPLRWGTQTELRRHIDNWGRQPLDGQSVSLEAIVGADVVTRLSTGIASSSRWGFPEGQGALISKLVTDNTFPIVLQEMLSGYFSPDSTLQVAYERVLEQLQGEDAAATEPLPTAEP